MLFFLSLCVNTELLVFLFSSNILFPLFLQEHQQENGPTIPPPTSESSDISNATSTQAASDLVKNQPKRLHVSNIPFRFRDPDLRAMFGVSIIKTDRYTS